MNSQFGKRIRSLRETHNLFLRHVAPQLNMDTAQLSKIEKGLRQLKRNQVSIIASILKANEEELLTLWVADQIIYITKNEDVALKAIEVAEKQIIKDSGKSLTHRINNL